MGKVASAVIESMIKDGKRFWAGDNISDYMSVETKKALIEEATEAFEDVLD